MLFDLCSSKQRYVYEVCDIFGCGCLTLEELEYWICYNVIERARFNDVDYDALPWDEVIKIVNETERKRKARHEKGSPKQKAHPNIP